MSAVHRTSPTFASANGLNLCYDTFGDKTAPPLLLIMGLAAQMIAWDDEFCTLLAERGYYVVRFDNRDIGLSSRIESAGVPDVGAAFMYTAPVPEGQPMQGPRGGRYVATAYGAETLRLVRTTGPAPIVPQDAVAVVEIIE